MNERELQGIITSVLNSVKTSSDMTLDIARRLSEKVREKAKQMGVNAVVAVTNKGARPVLIECMDDSFIASYDVAANKAFTVVSLKMSTIKLKELAQPGGSLYGIQFTNEGKIVIFGGGEPLKAADGSIIGGLGVSGGTEEQDTALAEYGRKIFEKGEF